MPWVGRFLLGDGTKAPCFFGVELYKITECCRGRGGLLPLVGRYSLGNSTKTTCFFGVGLHKITECWRGRG